MRCGQLSVFAKLGFTSAIIPKANAPKHKIEGMQIIAVERVETRWRRCGKV